MAEPVLIAFIRHGDDTEEGTRPLKPGEADALRATLRPKLENALGGPVEESHSSTHLRAKETATAVSDIVPIEEPILARFPTFAPDVKPLAKALGMDSSEAHFEIHGLEGGRKLGWDNGGSTILAFATSLALTTAKKRILLTAHGAALESVAAYVRGFMSPAMILRKGEGFVLKFEDGIFTFVVFLKRS